MGTFFTIFASILVAVIGGIIWLGVDRRAAFLRLRTPLIVTTAAIAAWLNAFVLGMEVGRHADIADIISLPITGVVFGMVLIGAAAFFANFLGAP